MRYTVLAGLSTKVGAARVGAKHSPPLSANAPAAELRLARTEGCAPSKLRVFVLRTLTEVAVRGDGLAALKALGDAVNKSTASMDVALAFFTVPVANGVVRNLPGNGRLLHHVHRCGCCDARALGRFHSHRNAAVADVSIF